MGFLGKLTAAVIQTAFIPVAIIKDVATMGGVLTDKNSTYTGQRLKEISKTVDDVIDDLKS